MREHPTFPREKITKIYRLWLQSEVIPLPSKSTGGLPQLPSYAFPACLSGCLPPSTPPSLQPSIPPLSLLPSLPLPFLPSPPSLLASFLFILSFFHPQIFPSSVLGQARGWAPEQQHCNTSQPRPQGALSPAAKTEPEAERGSPPPFTEHLRRHARMCSVCRLHFMDELIHCSRSM